MFPKNSNIYQYMLIYKYTYARILKYQTRCSQMEIFLKTVGSLYDETRLKILLFIHVNGEICVCDIESSFAMSQSRISRHLKILKEAGFLKVDRRGRWAYYGIRKPLDEFRQSVLKEISCLQVELPTLKKGCQIG